MARIITITSGKGGVGKTSISLNLSLALAAEGFRVCLFDADLGLANVSILTGIYPERDLASVISGQFSLNEIMIRDFMGIDIIPGSNGVEKIADLTRTQTGTLISAFLDMDVYDFFIFDTSAGISSQVLSFCMASHEVILVATCEPTSLTDAYAMLKALSRYKYSSPVRVVINQVKSGDAAKKAYNSLKQTAGRFLPLSIQPLGVLAADRNVRAAVISQTPFIKLFPDTLASKCINAMAGRLLKNANMVTDVPMELFWDKALRFVARHAPEEKDNRAEERPANTVPRRKPARPKQDLSFQQDLQRQLLMLESKITALANDVIIIKEMMKRGRQPEPPARKPEKVKIPPVDIAVPGKKISLDFESWYENRKQS